MKTSTLLKSTFLCIILGSISSLFGDNQTPAVDVPEIAGKDFPFKVDLELSDLELPIGLHSGAYAIYNDKWLFVGGRTNGMHGFSETENNFPPRKQNTDVIVVDPKTGKSHVRSLECSSSGLEQWQIDLLSVTSPQFLQLDNMLYITGGYGIESATGEFNTKPYLTAINIPGLIHWVEHDHCEHHDTAAKHIRHLFHEIFQVTGGSMQKIGNHPILLIVGQNFKGLYRGDSNGEYTQQIRRFDIIDDGKCLKVKIHPSMPTGQDPNLRRRDLNVVPILKKHKDQIIEELDVLSGVFTLSNGIWTVPVRINAKGDFHMDNPAHPETFKQGMNNYNSAAFGLFSLKTGDMYTILLGGISFGYFQDGQFQTDSNFPYINQITAIKIDNHNKYTQYLLKDEFPSILSNNVNPNNPLLFGAGAWFIPLPEIQAFKNAIIYIEDLESKQSKAGNKQRIPVGYVVGGIASSKPNTTTRLDTKASQYIFKVFIELNP